MKTNFFDNKELVIDAVPEEWLRQNYEITKEISLGNGKKIILQKLGYCYCFNHKQYDSMTENEITETIRKNGFEYYCVLRYGKLRCYHYTKATENEIRSSGLKATTGLNYTLAEGVYCYNYADGKPERFYANYIEIEYNGPYLECIVDIDPQDFGNGIFIGKDGYYSKQGESNMSIIEESISHKEYLLPVYNISYNKLVYHKVK